MVGSIELDVQTPFAGRYHIVRRIAAGGMGAVFEVVHIETQRRRALKVMLPELVQNRELRDRFQMEARITARVDSEYIVDVFDAGIDERTGMPFLVMELLQGEELGNILNRAGPVPPQLVVTYLRQVASALDKTHAAGIIHRDLKPENLFLTHREDGTARIKILDFGISKVVSEANTGGNATRALGTPLYMALEQVLGQAVGPATDLYALGLIAYTLLVGVAYWQADADKFDNAIAFALHTTRGTAGDSAEKRAANLGRALPPRFDAWFQRATHADPSQRFRQASEAINELAAVLSGSEIPRAFGAVPHSGAPHLTPPGYHGGVTPIVAGTAPGTEFDRSGTLPGAKRNSGLVPVVIGSLLFGGAALAGVAVWHGHAPAPATEATHSAVSSLSPTPERVPVPVLEVAPPPAAPQVASAEPVTVVPAQSASAAALASSSAKPLAVSGAHPASKAKAPAAPKAPAPAAPAAAPAPKYTRD